MILSFAGVLGDIVRKCSLLELSLVDPSFSSWSCNYAAMVVTVNIVRTLYQITMVTIVYFEKRRKNRTRIIMSV